MFASFRKFGQSRISQWMAWALVFLPFALTEDLSIGLGHSGLVALSIAVLTGFRSRWVDRAFGSLSSSYRLHHLVSLAAFALLIGHVLIVTLPFFSVDWLAAVDFLTDFGDVTITTGWISLGLILLTLGLARAKRLHRPLWRALHRLGTMGWIMALLHYGWAHAGAPLGAPDFISLASIALALAVLILNVAWPQALRSTREFEVSNVIPIAPNAIEIALRPLLRPSQKPMRFTPGQFAYLSFHCTQGCGVSHELHPFTIDSAPEETEVRMAIKALGDDTAKLLHLRPGTQVTMEGPYGRLLSDIQIDQPQLWIAGGIGLTPFLSYLRSLRGQENQLDIALLILVSHPEDVIFANELANIQRDLPHLQVHVHIDTEQGPFSISELTRLVPDWESREVALSGPSSLVRTFGKLLRKNVHRRRGGVKTIHMEAFDF